MAATRTAFGDGSVCVGVRSAVRSHRGWARRHVGSEDPCEGLFREEEADAASRAGEPNGPRWLVRTGMRPLVLGAVVGATRSAAFQFPSCRYVTGLLETCHPGFLGV